MNILDLHPTRLCLPLLLSLPLASPVVAQGLDPAVRAGLLSGAQPSIDLDRVYYDEPGDGHLWARGRTYKARFGAEGARFIPYLGAQAPRNRPVDFKLAEVSLGGEPLAFDAPERARRDGDLVSLDRGSLIELYAMEADSMEQLFRFDRLPRAGELVVKVAVETDLAPLERAEGFEWGCQDGCVRYGRATVLDGLGASAAAETRLLDGVIEIRVPAAFVAQAALPLVIDPVVSSYTVSTSPASDLFPDIAWEANSGNYLMVWQRAFSGNDADVWAEMRNLYGGYVGSSGVYIDLTSTPWENPSVASHRGGSQFMVVAEVGFGATDIYARRYESENAALHTPDAIVTGSITYTNPDIGGTSNTIPFSDYYIVWEAQFGSGTRDIWGRAINNLGTTGLINYLESSSADATSPAISSAHGVQPFETQRWTVVYERLASPGNRDVWGIQLDTSGAFASSSFLVHGTPSDEFNPSVSTLLDGGGASRPCLVVYQRDMGSHDDIYGKVHLGSLGATPPTNITEMNGSLWSSRNQFLPSVEGDGSTFLVAWGETTSSTGNDIFACTLTWSDLQLKPGELHRTLANGLTGESFPRVAAPRTGGGSVGQYMVLWNSFPELFSGDIYAARYLSPGAGDHYCSSLPSSAGTTATLQGQGSISMDRNEMLLVVNHAPANKPGIFFFGPNQINLPFGEGRRCVGGATRRIPTTVFTDSEGIAAHLLDVDHAVYGPSIYAGAPGLNFQYWFRDPMGGPDGFNLSNGLHIEFQP